MVVKIAGLFGSFLLALVAALSGLPAAAADKALNQEQLGVVDAINALCQQVLQGDTGLTQTASGIPLTTEPVLFRGENVGERYRFQFNDRYAVRFDHVHPEGRPVRFVAEVSAPTPALRLAPLIFLGIDQRCELQQGRLLTYEGETATSLAIFNAAQDVIGTEILNPPVPDASLQEDNTGVLVAMVDSGVNYLLPGINRGLARDTSGQLLGYDFWDLDALPFDTQAPGSPFFVQRHGTRTASLLLREAPSARLVSYRYPRPDMSRMSALVEHAHSIGVRIIGMPLGSRRLDDWVAFEKAAKTHPEILFVVSAGNNGSDIDQQPIYPASMQIDNMIVVTSADDFQRPAERTNWGVESVDYLVPAESRLAMDFSGEERQVSGSSYAVSRVAALAVNLLAENPLLSTGQLKQRIAGLALAPGRGRYVKGGYIPNPVILQSEIAFRFVESTSNQVEATGDNGSDPRGLSVAILVLDPRWQTGRIQGALDQANEILATCEILIENSELFIAETSDNLKDLSAGTAHTVLNTFRKLRPETGAQITLVFARTSKMEIAFEAEAFGEGNTSSRRWLNGSLWVTYGARDLGITLAHEMFHILANDGSHSLEEGNLMSEETSSVNVGLTESQCEKGRGFFD